jgi:hypothetical protein
MPSAREAAAVVEPLRKQALALRDFLDRVERLQQSRLLLVSDVHKAYEGALLTWNTTFEKQLEFLFLGLLTGRLKIRGGSVRPRLRVDSTTVAFDIMKGNSRFVDWLPINSTVKRAQLVFAGGRPFDLLQPADHDAFATLHKVRNAIAHRSGPAMKKFKDDLIAGHDLPPAQHSPAGYLRGSHTQGVTRMIYLITQTTVAMNRFCTKR